MKQRILLFLLATLFVCSRGLAATVSVETAQTVALNFFKLNAKNLDSRTPLTAALNYTKTEGDNIVFYVFDMAPVKGFVIVTADDNLEPVIAYSTESYFHSDAGKFGVKDWMDEATAKIVYALRANAQADERISNLWDSYKSGNNPGIEKAGTVGPLLTTTWDQENDISTPPPYLYNLLCPYNSSQGERCVTGCVATAMAQIMKYWNYPPTGTGSYSYTASGYGVQSANFGATTYNWAGMPSVLTLSTTASQDSTVDILSYQCGVAVAMEYGDDDQGGSGAWVLQSEAGAGEPCAQQAYVKYFGYNSSTLQGVHSSSYSSSAWVSLIENELNANRVVQLQGTDPGVGGHTWVCDGYESSTMFHMNWGWGGFDNGYFSLSDLAVDGYVFSSDDGALIGIEPNTTSSCGTPSGLNTTNLTSTGATFNWTAVTGATSYNIQYEEVGASAWTTGTSTSTTFNASGLTAGTNYQWEVQAVCSGGSSSFTSATAFTTSAGATCGVPGTLAAGSLASTSASLTWGAVSGATSYNLQWKASSASTWTSVTGLSSATYPLSGLSACTAYEFELQAVCSGGNSSYSSAYSFTTTGCTVTYCASSATSQAYEYIKNVTLGSIDNTTAAAGYANYTNLSTNLTAGSTYTITLTPGFTGSSYSEYFTVYIDYNQNGVFTDVGETVVKVNGRAAVSKTFTVPTTALNGATRMRIQMQYGAYETNSCATFTYGGVQDYTVNISGGETIKRSDLEYNAMTTPNEVKLYPNPAQDNVTVQFTSTNNGVARMNVYNITGQKVISQDNASVTGGNIVDLNTNNLSSGVYIFELENNGDVNRQKFIISR